MQADLALFTLDELRFSGALDPVAALVLCSAHRADRVMGGRALGGGGRHDTGTGHGRPDSATHGGNAHIACRIGHAE
jgi:hypothetical protein